MVFLMNIGNSNTQLAEFENGRIGNLRQVRTEQLEEAMLPEEGVPIAAATVVPEVREKLAGRAFFYVSPATAVNLDLTRLDCTTIGSDRLANAVELAANYPLPGLVVDFGTAITIEVVDGRRRFLGGAIAPGRLLLRQSLHQGTAQLPFLPLDDTRPERRPAGNTRDAMRLGIDLGAVGMVRELIRATEEGLGASCRTLLGVGGDAPFFLQHLSGLQPGGNDFTLRGIYRAWELNQ
ncbi:type III pantothenate kinase [Victivallis sp. Marseille-Q1083]|uniref:type III pantothenate kinase n=1 Tax=Victivallis sp. Marseille-Q1083 TaxID=2717288 RepID=UPI0015896F9F|nr:type III pantothenate kinase [Victivallis sp. Marseille-Q1083]